MRPAWITQSPALRQLSSRRLTCAATRFATSTRPTRAPPGKTGILTFDPGTRNHTRKLRMYAFTAGSTPRVTCASVHATTSTIKRARQIRVSLRDVNASQARPLIRGITAEALEEASEIRSHSANRTGVPEHLQEPGVPVDGRKPGDQPALLLPFAREVVDRDGPRLGVQRLAHGGEARFIDRTEADLPAPAVHVGELSSRRPPVARKTIEARATTRNSTAIAR